VIPLWGCCEAADEPDICEESSFCMDLGDEDTCMAEPEWPRCWTDGDCMATQTCEDEQICTCMQDCESKSGVCQTFDFDCEDNGGSCEFAYTECPPGSSQGSDYTGCEVWEQCCLPDGMFYTPWVEVTGPSPVPVSLSHVDAYEGSETPPVTEDISGHLLAVGAVQAGNQEGCDPYTYTSSGPFIALVQRGNCTFTQKVTNAANAGALAIIVYNNQAGVPQGWTASGTIPMMGIEQTPGEAMYTFASNNLNTATATIHPY
jgi:hypothetical protein